MEGPPKSISNRSPIRESTPGITVGCAPAACGGAASTLAGTLSSSTLPLYNKQEN